MNSHPKLLAAALAATSSMALAQTYSVGPVVSTGSTATAVAAGDLNRDGAPDIVATSGWNDQLTVALGTLSATQIGNVQRTLTAPTAFAVGGSYPRDVALVDLDRDGRLDAVTANRDSDDISVMLGDGVGGFGAATQVAVGTSPHSLIARDFNNDDIADVVVSNAGSGDVTLLLGDGSGGFSSVNSYPAAGTPLGMTFGDFDVDGNMDIAVAGRDNNVLSVLINLGAGFAAPVTVTAPRPDDVCCEDFNGDGNLDLVTADARGQISILDGDGLGGFALRTNFGTLNGGWSQHLTCGDMDLDGDVDVLVVGANDVVSFLPNSGAGTFGRATLVDAGAGASAVRVRIHDVDTDGNPDIVLASEHSWDARVIYNDEAFPTLIVGFPDPAYADGFQGTPGCKGFLGIRSTEAVVGQDFILEVTNAPADATGLFLLGGPPQQMGTAPFNTVNINVHLGPPVPGGTGLLETLLMDSNLVGTGMARTTIPTFPPLAGAQFYLQTVWIEKEGDGQCSPSPLGVITSRLLDVTIQ